MKYKMLAIDVDDTLIDDQKRISANTRQALAEALSMGVKVTLATGRMHASAKQIAAQLKLNVPLISYQGALIKNLEDDTVLYERHVPKEAVQHLFEYAERHRLHIQAYVDDELYVKEDNEKIQAYSRLSDVPYRIEPDLGKLSSLPMPKVIIIDEPDKLDAMVPELANQLGDQVHITKSKPNFLEFMHKEGTKGHAVAYLAEHFGCTLSEVIGIGDSWNDKEMLEVAGLGVAMGNAVEPLKEIADFITRTNNEDGVCHVVETFILERNG
ncbi:HAD family phosphatase [Xylanibacillus composti]|uniref:Haloacid dehalogenase n=1 Tax=Xylanibacillus composti TaxID=1572762 RepID=A0A8J4H1H3_9BACL|nr:Cof-type HAD-IIB family hydrolase [Xylanibacillus composti]MDT9723980.1 HAD family phosphatase [Xylanibacillus composti]GIQ67861.1 haloacid dehalogenase [Xylanibacillus composti]